MSFCATSRRLGAETSHPNLTISGPARETGTLNIVEAHPCEQYCSEMYRAEDQYGLVRGAPIVGSHHNKSHHCISDRCLHRRWRGISRSRSLFGIPVVIVGIIIASALKMANTWQKFVILRAGELPGVKGPGLFLIIPVIDHVVAIIDERIQTTAFSAEAALTKDTVR